MADVARSGRPALITKHGGMEEADAEIAAGVRGTPMEDVVFD